MTEARFEKIDAIRAHVASHGDGGYCPNALPMLRRVLALYDLVTDPEWQAAAEAEDEPFAPMTTAELRDFVVGP